MRPGILPMGETKSSGPGICSRGGPISFYSANQLPPKELRTGKWQFPPTLPGLPNIYSLARSVSDPAKWRQKGLIEYVSPTPITAHRNSSIAARPDLLRCHTHYIPPILRAIGLHSLSSDTTHCIVETPPPRPAPCRCDSLWVRASGWAPPA